MEKSSGGGEKGVKRDGKGEWGIVFVAEREVRWIGPNGGLIFSF